MEQTIESKSHAAELAAFAAHPLDALSAAELEETAHILRREKQLGEGVRFCSMTLLEPSRRLVTEYQPGAGLFAPCVGRVAGPPERARVRGCGGPNGENRRVLR